MGIKIMGSKNDYVYEENVAVVKIKITEEDYNERVARVIKCLLEMGNDHDKTEAIQKDFIESEVA